MGYRETAAEIEAMTAALLTLQRRATSELRAERKAARDTTLADDRAQEQTLAADNDIAGRAIRPALFAYAAREGRSEGRGRIAEIYGEIADLIKLDRGDRA